MTTMAQERLRGFAVAWLEWQGAAVDWPNEREAGEALLPPAAAARLRTPEVASLSTRVTGADLAVNLASDFLERTEAGWGTGLSVTTARLPGLYLKQKPLDEAIDRAFAFPNARVRLRATLAAGVEYHLWFFRATLASEDRWEDLVHVALNARSRAVVPLPDLSQRNDLEECASSGPPPATHAAAMRAAEGLVRDRARPFLARMTERRERDRWRLCQYYQALLRESKARVTRTRTEESRGQREAQARAVHLELRRKLLELDERYAVRSDLKPVACLRVELPALVAECDVQRRQARRSHFVYWNAVIKELEPLACGACGASTFAATFTENEVSVLCSACAKGGEAARLRPA